MKAVKKLNNNVALCEDSAGRRLVAFGKGIGFPAMPYEISDLSRIERTYYDMEERFLPLFSEIPSEVFEAARRIADRARSVLGDGLSASLPFTLADHIHFCLVRRKKNLTVRLPALAGIERLYPAETQLAREALALIRETLGVSLDEAEISGIAMNLINAEEQPAPCEDDADGAALTEGIVRIIETCFDTQLDRESYDFVRLDTHLRYLYDRLGSGEPLHCEYAGLYEPLRLESPQTEDCVGRVAAYLKAARGIEIDSNERLYLWLHIDRAVKKAALRGG